MTPIASAASTPSGAISEELSVNRETILASLVLTPLVALPLVSLHYWIPVLVALCALWSWQIYCRRWAAPRTIMRIALVLSTTLPLLQWGSAGIATLAISMLAMTYAFKLLELRAHRDLYIIVLMGYSLVAVSLLFNSSIYAGIYAGLCCGALTVNLVIMHQTQPDYVRAVRTALGLLAQAAPLVLVLFVLFPRIDPLWARHAPSIARTGISDFVRPGDIAELIQSNEVAFRVSFDGPAPAVQQRYWRGLVYETWIDGGWRAARSEEQSSQPLPDSAVLAYQYEVLMAPSSESWLYALDYPIAEGDIVSTSARTLRAAAPVNSPLLYSVQSYHHVGEQLDYFDYRHNLALPAGENPRLQTFARSLRAQHRDDASFVAALQAHLASGGYGYTLTPTLLPRSHAMDALWFESKQGFCAHFASASAFILRSAGIPTRLVGGYRGGSLNALGGHLVVRQSDAHVWVESWIDGAWQRFDPTDSVPLAAPVERISAVREGRERPDSEIAMFSALEWAEHRWNVWVAGFDQTKQKQLLERLLGQLTPQIWTGVIVAVLMLFALLGGVAVWAHRRPKRHRDPLRRAMQNFERRAARHGLQRDAAEPISAFIERCTATHAPQRPHSTLALQIQAALYAQGDPQEAAAALQRWSREIYPWRRATRPSREC